MNALASERRRRSVDATLRMAVRERERVLAILAAHFRTLSAPERERCVDEAFDYHYAEGEGRLVGHELAFRSAWITTAKRRALNECVRSRQRLRSKLSLSEPQVAEAIESNEPEAAEAIEARRDEYRAEELLASLTPKQRLLAEAMWGAPPNERARRHMCKKLGWNEEGCKWHLKGMRARIASYVADRESGALCERVQQTISDYVSWSTTTRLAGAGILSESETKTRAFEAMWWHLQHCDACAAASREVDQLEGAIEYALAPPLLFLAVCLIWLHNLASVAKAKAIAATTALVPARAKAAGGGGGATGAAISTVGGKAAVCVGAAICAAASGLVVAGSAPLVTHRPSPARHRVARVTHEAHAAVVTASPAQVVEPTASAPPHSAAPSAPPIEAPPLVLHPLRGARSRAADAGTPAPRLHLRAPRGPAEAPPLANAASLGQQEGASSHPSEMGAQPAPAGCSAPGDLGC